MFQVYLTKINSRWTSSISLGVIGMRMYLITRILFLIEISYWLNLTMIKGYLNKYISFHNNDSQVSEKGRMFQI